MPHKLTAQERYDHYLKYPYGRYMMVETFGPSIYGCFGIISSYFDYFEPRSDKLYKLTRIDGTSATSDTVESEFFMICKSLKELITHKMYEWNPDTQCHDIFITELN